MQLFKTNKTFRESVKFTSKEVLENSWKDYDDSGIEQATNYLLNEIAFLEFAPKYFKVDSVSYVYHKPRRIYEDYIAWIFDWITKFHLDFHLLEAPYETYLTHQESELSRLDMIRERWVIKCAYVPYTSELFEITQDWFKWLFYEIISHIAKKNNLQIEFVEQSWYGVLADRINSWFVDIFCAPVRPTKSRRLKLFFSKSLAKSSLYGYMRSDTKYKNLSIQELSEIPELRVVIKENDIHHDIMKELLPNTRIVWLPQLAQVWEEINYVLDNRADIAFREDKLVEWLLKTQWIDNKKLIKKNIDTKPIKIYENCMALPRWDFELKEMIDDWIEDFFVSLK